LQGAVNEADIAAGPWFRRPHAERQRIAYGDVGGCLGGAGGLRRGVREEEEGQKKESRQRRQ
jgi:hypothetical protein